MNKLKIFFALAALFVSSHLHAAELLFKISDFKPWSETFREIYGKHETFFGLELRQHGLGCFSFFLQADYMHERGKSTGVDQETILWLVPYGAGIIGHFPLAPFVKVYIGGGPILTWIQIHNDSSVVENIHHTQRGYLGKAGLNLYVPKSSLSVDVFVEASYCNASIGKGTDIVGNHNFQVGGVKAGAGVGYRF